MSLVYILNLISSAMLIAPVAVIILTRLRFCKTIPFLLFYLLMTLVYNLMTIDIIHLNREVIYYAGIANNLLDGPLMLSFILFLATKKSEKIFIKKLIGLLVLFTVAVVVFAGFGINTIRIVLGPTVVACLFFSVKYFIRYSKVNMRKSGRESGKTSIAASLVIAYSSFLLIYLLYYIFTFNPMEDAQIVYFLATSVSWGILCSGLIREVKRLRKIKEVQVMRKELAVLYADDINNPRPRRPRTLDELLSFDISEIIAGYSK